MDEDKSKKPKGLRSAWGIDSGQYSAILEIEIAPRWTCRKAPAGLFFYGGSECP
jgi:hypothetical protein